MDKDNIETIGSIPRWRLWLFRLMAITVIPVAVLLTLEISLRIVGNGYHAGALSKTKWKGQTAYYNNYRFGWRFWPPSIARESEPYFFTAKKTKDTYRIFILGGSAALGTPEPSYSFGRMLEVMLENQYPQTNFEVINTAITAINSHVVLPIAKSCAAHNGDLFVIYLGNNEVIGPYGAGTIFAPLSDNMALIRFDKAMQTTRIGQLLKNILNGKQTDKTAPKVWGGSKMFMEHLIRKDNETLQVVYKHYKRNLEDITRTIRKRGAQVILCSVGSNLKDNAPFASLHRTDMTDSEKGRWDNLYEQGAAFEISGKHEQSLESFLTAAEIDNTYAELHFRTARAYWQLGHFERARNEYIVARELDTLRLRADNRINKIVREVAQTNKGKGIYFVDAAKTFEQHSPNNTPGEELFYEHVHLNFKGNYILASTVFQQVEDILPQQIKNKRASGPVLSEQHCANKLAYTDWNKYMIARKVLDSFITKAPFTSRLYNKDIVDLAQHKLENLKAHIDEESLTIAERQYLQAIQNTPGDWVLHWNYAKLLTKALENPRAGAEQYHLVTELVPNSYSAQATYGLALANLGNFDAAITSSLAALKLNPSCADAHYILGISYAQQGLTDKAMEHFSSDVRIRPNRAQGYNRMGVLLDKQGKGDKAEEVYRKGLTACPDDVALHYNLAILLAKQNRFEEATKEIQAALKSRPNSVELLRLLDMIKRANKQT